MKKITEGTCVHFNGTQHDACLAGFSYRSVARPLTQDEIDRHNEHYAKWYPDQENLKIWGLSNRLPCWERNNVKTCEKFCPPTAEQVQEYEGWLNDYIPRMLKRVNTTRAAIVKRIKEKGMWERDCSGMIPCLVCKTGTVSYSYAGSYNGHIHARCDTPECVQWME